MAKKKKTTVPLGTVAVKDPWMGVADKADCKTSAACAALETQIAKEFIGGVFSSPPVINQVTVDENGNYSVETDCGKIKIDAASVNAASINAETYVVDNSSDCAVSVGHSNITAITTNHTSNIQAIHDAYHAARLIDHAEANGCVIGDFPGCEPYRVGDFPDHNTVTYPGNGQHWMWPYQNQPWREIPGIQTVPGTLIAPGTMSAWTTAFPGVEQPLDGKFRFIHRKKVEVGMYKNRIPIFIKKKFTWNISSMTAKSNSMTMGGIPHTSRRFG